MSSTLTTASLIKKMSIRLKFFLLIVLIAFISAGAWYAFYANNWQIIYSALIQEDAAKISAILKEQGVPFMVVDGGTAIAVDSKNAEMIKLNVASESLALSRPVGFEIFNESDFGLTEFSQRVNYQRAIEGELSRSINQMDGIRSSRVHLSLPERRVFSKDAAEAKAAVVLLAEPGIVISKQSADSIRRLVASAVDGLDESAVSVVDGAGVPLAAGVTAGDAGAVLASREQSTYINAVEAALDQKIIRLLQPLLGFGVEYRVASSATIDFNKRKSTTTNLLAAEDGQGFTLKQKEASKAEKGDDGSVVKGADRTTEKEFNYGSEIVEIVVPDGQVAKITVSVVVYAELDESHLETIKALVQGAIGFNHERGDSVIIASLPAVHKKNHSEPKIANDIDVPSKKIGHQVSVPQEMKATAPAAVENSILILRYLVVILAGTVVALIAAFFYYKKQRKLREQHELEKLKIKLDDWLRSQAVKINAAGDIP